MQRKLGVALSVVLAASLLMGVTVPGTASADPVRPTSMAPGAFIATFPIVVGTAAGLHAADENARMLFKTMGATRLQTLVRMKLPSGLPHFFTGLKIASVGVMAGAITGEFLGGGKGFGEQIRVAATQLDTPRVFALIIYLSLLGLATFGLVVFAQRKLVFWHKATVRDEGALN